MHFRVTEGKKTGNGISKWKHIKWTDADSSTACASRASHATESYEFEIGTREKNIRKSLYFENYSNPKQNVKDRYDHIHIVHQRGNFNNEYFVTKLGSIF